MFDCFFTDALVQLVRQLDTPERRDIAYGIVNGFINPDAEIFKKCKRRTKDTLTFEIIANCVDEVCCDIRRKCNKAKVPYPKESVRFRLSILIEKLGDRAWTDLAEMAIWSFNGETTVPWRDLSEFERLNLGWFDTPLADLTNLLTKGISQTTKEAK